MNIDLKMLEENLCKIMCAQVRLRKKNEKLIVVETPFSFSDGDPYQIYIKEQGGGVIRLTDAGHTLMHLSYENDIDKFREGTRGSVFNQILVESGLTEGNGEFFIDTPISDLGFNIFRFGQGLTKINDITFLNRVRVESTFYDDLSETLSKLLPESKIHKNYIQEGIENAEDYPIDYKIDTTKLPLFLFGIPGKDKARLTTIILERLLREQVQFESLIVFQDQESISPKDLARLSNVGGEMVASLSSKETLERKIRKLAELN